MQNSAKRSLGLQTGRCDFQQGYPHTSPYIITITITMLIIMIYLPHHGRSEAHSGYQNICLSYPSRNTGGLHGRHGRVFCVARPAHESRGLHQDGHCQRLPIICQFPTSLATTTLPDQSGEP